MLDPYLDNTRLCIDKNNKTIETKFEISGADPSQAELEAAINKIEEIQPIIVILSNLLAYLESEGLVTIYSPINNGDKIVTIGMGAENRASIDNKFPDQKICDMVVSFVHKEIIPNQELVNLLSNEFVSDQEKRFKKQQSATWVSIIIAGVIGIGGILYQVIDRISGKGEQKDQVKFVKTEILNLNRHIENLANKPVLDISVITNSLYSINGSLERLLFEVDKVNRSIENQSEDGKGQNVKIDEVRHD